MQLPLTSAEAECILLWKPSWLLRGENMTLILILEDYYLLAPMHSHISIKFGTAKRFRGH